jgi:hypothetical protein
MKQVNPLTPLLKIRLIPWAVAVLLSTYQQAVTCFVSLRAVIFLVASKKITQLATISWCLNVSSY